MFFISLVLAHIDDKIIAHIIFVPFVVNAIIVLIAHLNRFNYCNNACASPQKIEHFFGFLAVQPMCKNPQPLFRPVTKHCTVKRLSRDSILATKPDNMVLLLFRSFNRGLRSWANGRWCLSKKVEFVCPFFHFIFVTQIILRRHLKSLACFLALPF